MQQMSLRHKHQHGIKKLLKDASKHEMIIRTNDERILHLKELQLKEGESLFAVQHTTVHKAAFDGSLPGIRYFLMKSTAKDLNIPDKTGSCPVHYCAEQGHRAALELLITSGVDPNTLSTGGLTPLMAACRSGSTETAKLLIGMGARLMVADAAGHTAAHLAAAGDHAQALACLLQGAEDRRVENEKAKRLQAERDADPLYIPLLPSTKNRGSLVARGSVVQTRGSIVKQRGSVTLPNDTDSATGSTAMARQKRASVALSAALSAAAQLSLTAVAPTATSDTATDGPLATAPVTAVRSRSRTGSILLDSVTNIGKTAIGLLPPMPILRKKSIASTHASAPADTAAIGEGGTTIPTNATQADRDSQVSNVSAAAGHGRGHVAVAGDAHVKSGKVRRRSSTSRFADVKRKAQTTMETTAVTQGESAESVVLDHPLAVLEASANNGARPLHLAATANCLSALTFLISKGVDVSAADHCGETALHRAARGNHYECYRSLKLAGARDDVTNVMWESPAKVLKDAMYL